MQMHFFTIPAAGGPDASDDLNRFLSSHCILSLDQQFVTDGPGSFRAAGALGVSFECSPASRPGRMRGGI